MDRNLTVQIAVDIVGHLEGALRDREFSVNGDEDVEVTWVITKAEFVKQNRGEYKFDLVLHSPDPKDNNATDDEIVTAIYDEVMSYDDLEITEMYSA